jgi:hypothetical protein
MSRPGRVIVLPYHGVLLVELLLLLLWLELDELFTLLPELLLELLALELELSSLKFPSIRTRRHLNPVWI